MPSFESDGQFAGFVEDSHRALMNLALALTGDAAEAGDLVQETLLSVMQRWRTTPLEYPFAYARKALVRTHISATRRPHRRRERTSDSVELEAEFTDLSQPGVQSFEDSSADRFVLRRALEQMPQRQRQVVVLRYLEDMSVSDVADLLGCTQGTVKRSTHAGLLTLRRAFEAQGSEDGADQTVGQRSPGKAETTR